MLRVVALCAACLLGTASAASAEWHFTPLLGTTFRANTSLWDIGRGTQKSHVNFGGSVALLGEGLLGVEAIGTFTPTFFESNGLVTGGRAFALMGNVVVAAPRRWTEYSLRPFVSAGVGLLNAHGKDSFSLLAPIDVLGFDIGGGAIGFLTKNTGVRLDLRYYTNLQGIDAITPSGAPAHLRYMTFSAGVVIRKLGPH